MRDDPESARLNAAQLSCPGALEASADECDRRVVDSIVLAEEGEEAFAWAFSAPTDYLLGMGSAVERKDLACRVSYFQVGSPMINLNHD